MFKEDIVAHLVKRTGTITFDKKDGTERVMNCTLMKSLLPEQMDIEEKLDGDRANGNPNVLAVWDLDKKDWRSFRIDSVKEMSFHEV